MKNKSLERYTELNKIKQQKLSLMREVQKYIDPKDNNLLRATITESSDVLFDSTARNQMEDYTLESLSDIINPFEAWFTLGVKQNIDVDKEVLKDWSKKATEDLYVFINSSDYYPNLIEDKTNFDLYGFSGMSILEGEEGPKINTEDVFDLVRSHDQLEPSIKEYYWMVSTSKKTLVDKFNVAEDAIPKSGTVDINKYWILCCLVPNDENFVDHPKGNQNYVYVRYLVDTVQKAQDQSTYSSVGEAPTKLLSTVITEVGERFYYDKCFLVSPQDRKSSRYPYGVGKGKRLLVEAQNLNQLRKDSLYMSRFSADPPYEAPFDIYAKIQNSEISISPGQIVPQSATGEQINPLVPKVDYRAQIEYLQFEDLKLRENVPKVQMPEKKARQSQFEIDTVQRKTAQLQLIHKIIYLQNGVSEHLKLLFEIALKQKKIEPLPEGLAKEDVIPSLGNIILKEFKKAKAQSYVQALGLLQGYASINPEVVDNIDTDTVAKNIYEAMGAGDVLLDEYFVDEIRQRREEMIKKQQEQQDQQLAAQEQQVEAQAALHSAQAGKALQETEALSGEGA